VLKKRIKRRKIGSLDIHRRRGRKLLLGGHDLENLVGSDRFAGGQEPSQGVVDKIKPFVFGGIEQLEILLDCGSFRGVVEQLIIGHAESRGGVHVVHVLVVDERTRLTDEGVDHVAKVDVFFAVTKLSGHPLDALILVPELKMVLMNADFELQADVLAAYRVRVSLHANDAVRLHRHRIRRACRATLWGHGAECRHFFTKTCFTPGVAASC